MQVQENDGRYNKPEPFDSIKLEQIIKSARIKRVLVFPAYGEDGKPTPEMRRAWRRWARTKEKY